MFDELENILRDLLVSHHRSLSERIEIMTASLDALTAQVQANSDATASAVALLGALKADLDAAIASQPEDDGAALQALSDKLAADDKTLADAVVASTPADPSAPVATPAAPVDTTQPVGIDQAIAADAANPQPAPEPGTDLSTSQL